VQDVYRIVTKFVAYSFPGSGYMSSMASIITAAFQFSDIVIVHIMTFQ